MDTQPSTSWFTVEYDTLARDRGTEEFLVWQRRMLAPDTVSMMERFARRKWVTVAGLGLSVWPMAIMT